MTPSDAMHQIQSIINRWSMNGITSTLALQQIEQIILTKQRKEWEESHK